MTRAKKAKTITGKRANGGITFARIKNRKSVMGTMLGTSYYDTNRLMTVTADDDNDNGCGMQSRENRNDLQASYLYRGHS